MCCKCDGIKPKNDSNKKDLEYRILTILIYLGFIDKPEGCRMEFNQWRWDFWNSSCRFSIWSSRRIKMNPLTF